MMVAAPGTSKLRRARGRGAARVGHEADGRHEGDQGHRDGQQEHPAPADLGEQAADDEAQREAGRAGGGVDGDRLVAGGALGEARRDDRQAGRGGEGRGDALDEARGDEQRAVVDEAAEQGGHGEDAERDQEDAPAPEQVGGAAAEQQEAAVAEHVGAHDPLEAAGGHGQVGADGRAARPRPSTRRARRGRGRCRGRAARPRRAGRVPRRPVVERVVMRVAPVIEGGSERGGGGGRRSCPLLFDAAPYLVVRHTSNITSETCDHDHRDTEPIEDLDLISVLQALSDPVRLEIVRQLAGCTADAAKTCGQIELDVSKSTASHHLKTLRCAGIAGRARGGHPQVHLAPQGRDGAALPGPAGVGAERRRAGTTRPR